VYPASKLDLTTLNRNLREDSESLPDSLSVSSYTCLKADILSNISYKIKRIIINIL
jgi:hypothetical protein